MDVSVPSSNPKTAALQFANRIRKMAGLPRRTKLLVGDKGSACSCPIARTIGIQDTEVGIASTRVDLPAPDGGRFRYIIRNPRVVRAFIKKHDMTDTYGLTRDYSVIKDLDSRGRTFVDYDAGTPSGFRTVR